MVGKVVAVGGGGQRVEEEESAEDCPATLLCSPEEVDVGQSLRCSVTAEALADSCTSRIELLLRVTQDDSEVCTDVIRAEQVEVDQIN